MKNVNEMLELAEKVAWSFHGTFYSWGGDDPSAFDCSGYVMEILQSVGIIGSKEDMNAEALYQRFEKMDSPAAGLLAFRFNEETGLAVHVGFMVSDEFVLHAAGGGSHVKTKEDAIKHNAFIKLRPVWPGAIFCDPFADYRLF